MLSMRTRVVTLLLAAAAVISTLSTITLLLTQLPARLSGQQQPFTGTPEMEQRLRQLNELGTVLMIAAHPDDERTAVLAYFARGRYMRTAYLSLTRGEGGQNLIGSEQGAQLGIIRTHELLAARKIDGAVQFFTRAIDFGFTKTASETLEKWGHDRILSDVVWVIRRYRPDVIILGFSGTPADGHGQHQVSAMLGKEAFAAAGDAARFPDQLRYVQPWRAKRIVRAEFNFGGGRGPIQPGIQPPPGARPTPPQPAFPTFPPLPPAGAVNTGEYNPILGYSYEELAVLSRSMHHSQGTGAMRHPGPGSADFTLVAGAPSSKDLFEGIDTTWGRLPGGAAVAPILADAIGSFEPAHPERVLPQLVKARPLIAAISDPLAKIKLAELDEAIAGCAGLWVEAEAHSAEVTPGAQAAFTTTVLNRSAASVSLNSASVEGMFNDALPAKPATLGINQAATIEFARAVPASQPYSQPYWLAKPPSGDVYSVDNQMLIGLPDTPPVLQVRVKLTVDGAPIEILRPVHYRYADRAEGERTRPFVVVPAVAVDLPESVALFPEARARRVHVAVKANVAKASGELRLDLPAGWKTEPRSRPFQIDAAGEQREMTFEITPPSGETVANVRAVASVGGRDIASGMQVIAYPHIPAQTLFPPSDIKVVRANIRVTARRVGYIMGAGDEMPECLRQLGLEVTLLSDSDLAQGDLSRFDAIVAGVRAYNVRAGLRANHARLLDYVRNGGTYIVQYNIPDPELNIGPYPITIPGGNQYRVTVEEAPVTFPHPDSRLLQAPNHINPKDFDGWIQERGLYFATEWDKRYETVLASHDPGDKPMQGGELWTRYDKGVYIFTAYSWFRQLPAGVPGAYRLFANMVDASASGRLQ
jgi:LmbE family N-acetylglucosaminyl deacetylase